MTTFIDPNHALAYGRHIMERKGELPPLMLLHTADDRLYAVDVTNLWGEQPERQRAVRMVGTLLGFGLQVDQFVPLVDTFVRAIDKDADALSTEELMKSLPPAADDPRSQEALLVCDYKRGETPTVLQQVYTRTPSLDGTTFEWEEPQDMSDPAHEDDTFSAFWPAVDYVLEDASTRFNAGELGVGLDMTVDQFMAVGRETAVEAARSLGLRFALVSMDLPL